MNSQKAKEFIDGCMAHLTVEMRDHATWQLRAAMTPAAELAEQEMEGFYTCWIDPKDFMPEANKNVLVKCSSGEIQTDFYAPELGGFFIEHSTHAKVTGDAIDEIFRNLPRLVRDKRDGSIELIDYDNAAEWRGDLERKPSLYQWLPINGNTL